MKKNIKPTGIDAAKNSSETIKKFLDNPNKTLYNISVKKR